MQMISQTLKKSEPGNARSVTPLHRIKMTPGLVYGVLR